ncbi:hypothetical protein PMAYCL1PPCAC_05433 [Pristionchus mayeri]|uniref:Uncharacterized protein n=1 Tax=Pristionchus mayeri TaxID=1317129 RepID=A0AAN5C318_9BILA|nr:hypothetical protein PMAYCL1PPCAC_05432 [Pristionchus mayeri]GMR35238.1 hypothetical protein PMAYCL1PPCAC_05433 [Pristionchus mayeri]
MESASSESPLSTVEEWKIKTCQFSNHSTEALAALFSRTFEGMSTVLRNPDHCHIQRALASIEFELSNSLRFEETGELSIRSLMFGLIESLHLTLTHLTEDSQHT